MPRFSSWPALPLLFLLLTPVAEAGGRSRFKHPLLPDGMAEPVSDKDVIDAFHRFASSPAADRRETGAAVLEAYLGRGGRIEAMPDVVAAFPKGSSTPVLSPLIHKGAEGDRLPNEPFLWMLLLVEDGEERLSVKPAAAGCENLPGGFQVSLNGLRYSQTNSTVGKLFKAFSSAKKFRLAAWADVDISSDVLAGESPLPPLCWEVSASTSVSGAFRHGDAAVRAAMIKLPLEPDSVNRVTVTRDGRWFRGATLHFANMPLPRVGLGIGAAAVHLRGGPDTRLRNGDVKGTIHPYVFGHLYFRRKDPWDRSLALAAGLPLREGVHEAALGLRYAGWNEWERPFLGRLGVTVGGRYRRPRRDPDSHHAWRLFVAVDWKL